MNKAEHKKLREEIKNDPEYQKMLKEIIKIIRDSKKLEKELKKPGKRKKEDK